MESLPPLATFLILVITGICTYRGFKNETFLAWCIFDPSRIIVNKEYHRLITPALIHGDWMHFLFNAISLYSFSAGIEKGFGSATLCFIYCSSIIGGNLLALLLHRHHSYRALGASGGVCGVIFASIFLFPNSTVSLLFIPIGIPASLYAILFLGISIYGIKAARDNVGHDAHLGGAIVGLLATTLCYPYIIERNPVLYPVVIVISIALFFFLFTTQGYPRRNLRDTLQVIVSTQQQRAHFKKEAMQDEAVDRILEKITLDGGMENLTEEEKELLKKASERKRTGKSLPNS